MSARGTMHMRAHVQRDANVGQGGGTWGQDSPPVWQDHILALPCRFWFDDTARNTQTVKDGDKDVVMSGRKLIVPEGTDIREDDRVVSIVDRLNRELADGPMRIDTVGRRKGHLILQLVDIR